MDDKKSIAAEIRDYLARERTSREQFAFKTKLGKSTVDKLLTGLYSDRTLAIVESHTGLKLRGKANEAPVIPAPEAPRTPEKPSIAVLPFVNMSGNPEHGPSFSASFRDVGAILIGEGLARPYICGTTSCPRRPSWC